MLQLSFLSKHFLAFHSFPPLLSSIRQRWKVLFGFQNWCVEWENRKEKKSSTKARRSPSMKPKRKGEGSCKINQCGSFSSSNELSWVELMNENVCLSAGRQKKCATARKVRRCQYRKHKATLLPSNLCHPPFHSREQQSINKLLVASTTWELNVSWVGSGRWEMHLSWMSSQPFPALQSPNDTHETPKKQKTFHHVAGSVKMPKWSWEAKLKHVKTNYSNF